MRLNCRNISLHCWNRLLGASLRLLNYFTIIQPPLSRSWALIRNGWRLCQGSLRYWPLLNIIGKKNNAVNHFKKEKSRWRSLICNRWGFKTTNKYLDWIQCVWQVYFERLLCRQGWFPYGHKWLFAMLSVHGLQGFALLILFQHNKWLWKRLGAYTASQSSNVNQICWSAAVKTKPAFCCVTLSEKQDTSCKIC